MSQELARNATGETVPVGGAVTLYSNAAGMYYLRKPVFSNDPAARAALQEIPPEFSSGFIGTVGIQRCQYTGPTPDPGDRIGCLAGSWLWQKHEAGNMTVHGTLPGNIALASPRQHREGTQQWQ